MQFELSPYTLTENYGEGFISLADAKTHLYVDHGDDDTLIGVMRDAAIDMTEKYNQVKLGQITGLKWNGEALCSPLKLGLREIRSIQSIDYLDVAGEAVSMAPSDTRIGSFGELLPAIGKSWPTDVGGQVVITFTAGFEDGKVPSVLIAAAKMFMAHLYANREDVIVGMGAVEIPMGFKMLCSQYRMPVI